MFRKLFGALALLLLIVLPIEHAQARRGIPIPIPGLRGETLVLVKELPRTPIFQRSDGTYVDLGYKFNSFSGGEWVGHIGSDSRFLTIPEPQLKLMLMLAGMTDFPPIPDRPWSWSGIFWVVIGGIAVLSFISKILKGEPKSGQLSTTSTTASTQPTQQAKAMASFARADTVVATARASRLTSASDGVQPARHPLSSAGRAAGASPARASFGRRA